MMKKFILMAALIGLFVLVSGCTAPTDSGTGEEEAVSKPPAKLVVKDLDNYNRAGTVTISGNVVNDGKEIAQSVMVYAVVSSPDGAKTLGEAQVGIGDIEAGATRPFVVKVYPTGGPEEVSVKVTASEKEEL